MKEVLIKIPDKNPNDMMIEIMEIYNYIMNLGGNDYEKSDMEDILKLYNNHAITIEDALEKARELKKRKEDYNYH